MSTQEVALFTTDDAAFHAALKKIPATTTEPVHFDVIRVDLERQPELYDHMLPTIDTDGYTYLIDRSIDTLTSNGVTIEVWSSYCEYVKIGDKLFEEVTEF